MARKLRVHYPGALYHVIVRGNDGQRIFFDDKDRMRFYFLLREGVERFGHRIHAFCLLGNHFHAAIQVGEVSLSRILQNLSFRYTRWVNWRQGRSGYLFQGRYMAVLVDADGYLLEGGYERFVWEGKAGNHKEEYDRGASGDSRILRDDAFAERILGEKQTVMRPKVTLVGLTKAVCSKYSIKEENWRDRAEIADYRKLEGWRPG